MHEAHGTVMMIEVAVSDEGEVGIRAQGCDHSDPSKLGKYLRKAARLADKDRARELAQVRRDKVLLAKLERADARIARKAAK